MSERQNIEWKRSWQDEYLKWICGFANAQGGSIFIGKDPASRHQSNRPKSGLGWDQVTPQVTPQVEAILEALSSGPISRGELQEAAGIKDREHFRKAYILNLIDEEIIELTIPDKPKSRLQKYRKRQHGTQYNPLD